MRQSIAIIVRRLMRERLTSLISFGGLTIGLTIVTLVLTFIINELNYNKSFTKSSQIVRILNDDPKSDAVWGNTPFRVGELANEQFAEVENFAHEYSIGNLFVKKGEEYLPEKMVTATEKSFFEIFDIKILHGELNGFDATNKVAVSKRFAEKIFGKKSAVNELLKVQYNGVETEFIVTAVYANLPKNGTIKPEIITNIDFGVKHLHKNLYSSDRIVTEAQLKDDWKRGIFFTNYLLLQKNTNRKELAQKIEQLGNEHAVEQVPLKLEIQEFESIYFGSGGIMRNGDTERGNKASLFVLGAIGFIILLIACVNYLNLASAQALGQARCFAVSKVCGSSHRNQVFQLILESSIIAVVAIPFALLLSNMLMPQVSMFLKNGYELELFMWKNIEVFAYIVLIALLIGVVSGLLVSFRFSAVNLIDVLKGKRIKVAASNGVRQTMVIFQLMAFIILISGMFIVKKQIKYAFAKDIGIKQEGLLRASIGDKDYHLFKEKALQVAGVEQISGALWIPPHNGKMVMTLNRVDDPAQTVEVRGLFSDYNFATTMGMQIIRGADFNKENNPRGVLVNESAVSALGLTVVIGEHTSFGKVVGLVKDFNMYSIREKVPPMIIGVNPKMAREVVVRVKTDNIAHTMAQLKDVWNSVEGKEKFNFVFTDEVLRKLYQGEQKLSEVTGWLAFIAIFIASLGLFGLSVLTGKQRIKEIGVRKVNGARIIEVIGLLNRDFVKWVIIALVLAAPIAYMVMQKWLAEFAYKTTISWWIFILAGTIAMIVTLLTVSFQSYRAATQNPVKALRYE